MLTVRRAQRKEVCEDEIHAADHSGEKYGPTIAHRRMTTWKKTTKAPCTMKSLALI